MGHRTLNGNRPAWMLNGLLSRASQSIGLHQNGELFGLPPLECEIRRRLWWLIHSSDCRVAEDDGLLTPTSCSPCYTSFPLNVDDADLHQTTTTLPEPKEQCTEMSMFLVALEGNRAFQQVYKTAMEVTDGSIKTKRLNQILQDLKARMHSVYLKNCDLGIPTQLSASLLGRMTLGKLELFIGQQITASSDSSVPIGQTHDTLTLACDTLSLAIQMTTNDLLKPFRWLFTSYTQHYLLTFIIYHLCYDWQHPESARAWGLVEQTFLSAQNHPNWKKCGPRWNILCKLYEKAQKLRPTSLLEQVRRADEKWHVSYALTCEQAEHSGESELLWEPEFPFYPNWLNLAQLDENWAMEALEMV